jgi:hypothetical protein
MVVAGLAALVAVACGNGEPQGWPPPLIRLDGPAEGQRSLYIRKAVPQAVGCRWIQANGGH